MDFSYIAIQIVGFIGSILYFASFQCKENKNLFRVQFLAYVFYTSHLLLLGATTGAFSYLLNLIRSICLGSNSEFARSNKMCALICFLQLCVLSITWAGWLSVLPVVANIAATIGGYTHNGQKIRIAGIFVNSPLWIVYDIYVGSWAGIVDELVSEASMLLSIYRFGWKNLDKEE